MNAPTPTAPKPTVLVIQPDPSDPLERFAYWLNEAGVALRVVRPFVGESVPVKLEDHGLIVLGGDMSSNDNHDHPWLADVRLLLRNGIEQARPTLGICLGSQLLAQSGGGTVTVGDRGIEAGVVPIDWLPAAVDDPLVAELPAPFPVGAWHGDMIKTLPDGAVWLGRSDLYPHQAFRLGTRAWGVQFHPEISPVTYGKWVADHEAFDEPTLELLRRGEHELRRSDDEIMVGTSTLASRYAELVLASARRTA